MEININMDEWVPIRRAAFILVREHYVNCSYSKLARLARNNIIEHKSDPLDQRVKLIHIPTLRELLRKEIPR